MSDLLILIISLAAVTYATRIGGYLILARFEKVHPRIEAALDAVPAAVLSALIIPNIFYLGIAEFITGIIAIAASLRFSMLGVVVIATVSIIILRQFLSSI